MCCFERTETFNVDRGSQFTGKAWTDMLKAHGVAISVERRDRFDDRAGL